jgi:hypothetical protein
MAVWLALLAILVIVVWAAIDDLKRRVSAIEAGLRERQSTSPVAAPQKAPAPAAPGPEAPAPAPPASAPPVPPPVPAPVLLSTEPLSTKPPPQEPAPILAPAPALLSIQPPTQEPVAATVVAPPSASWELVVGASWLSKIGALVVVIGVALFARYAFAEVTPIGRVASGYAATIGMLAFGVVLERRDRYRNYAYALIAGGWAGVYFMTYAMHAVDATRVIDDDFVAVSCLAVVAAGMIAHSLRYRSPTVTTLAYLVAYATLALTPLSGFSLVASIPLSVSVIVVAQRFDWSGVSMAGVASTYGLFAIRREIFAGGVMDAHALAPYATLAAYWLTFEIADILAIRRRRGAAADAAPLFAMNAVGFAGAAVLELPLDDSIQLSWFLAASGMAYLASAIVRARLLGRRTVGSAGTDVVTFGTVHAALAIGAGLFAGAIDLRFEGRREVLVLLLEAEMLVASGFALRDRYIRLIGSTCAVLVSLCALQLVAGVAVMTVWSLPVHTWTPVLALVAVAWYGNREWLRGRGVAPVGIEYGYTWVASALVLAIVVREFSWLRLGLASLVFSAGLVEAGVRRGREYRYQAYLIAIGATELILLNFVVVLSPIRDAWIVLPAAVALAYLLAGRLARRARSVRDADLPIAAGAMVCLGTAFLAVFEWRVLEEANPVLVGPAWTLTALACLGAGIWRRIAVLRWQGYVLLFAGAATALQPIVLPTTASPDAIFWMSAIIGALYTASLVSRRAVREAAGGRRETEPFESECRLAISITATLCLTMLLGRQVRPTLVTLAWGAEGLALLALGLPVRERVMRLSGLALLFLCILKLFIYDLSQLEELARILSFVGLGVALLAVSWAYTRYQEQIKRLW